jgi:hypothetical protein
MCGFNHRLDDEGNKLFRNIGKIVPDYAAQHFTRQSSSHHGGTMGT